MRRTILTAIIAAFVAAPASAQQPAPRVDRIGHIVAVVGDSAILNFDIQDGVLAMAAQSGQTVEPGSPTYQQLAEQVLEMRITELLMLQAAARDTTIRVPDDQINRMVEEKIEEDTRQVGGLPALELALGESGLTLQAYRERLVRQFTKQSMIEQYRSRQTRARRAPTVTEAELSKLYETYSGEIGMRPATITLQRVIVAARASEEEYEAARVRADSVFALIRAGGDFATLARQFGEDDTRERGGDLGWIRRSDMGRAFADVAFSLGPGSVSAPVRTPFGYHLIKVERARGAEVQVSHILFQPEIVAADIDRARARADTVAMRLRADADAAQLREEYGDPDRSVRIGPIELAVFQQQFGIDAAQASRGQVFDPIPTGSGSSISEFAVLRVLEQETERPWTIDDPALREQLRSQAVNTQLMAEIVEDLRRSTYVEIRGF